MGRVRVGALAACVVLAACGGKSRTEGPRRGETEGAASCDELARRCGPQADEDCCASPLVPGGMFYRSYDATTTSPPGPYTSTAFPATVSDFRLDRFEVTVARFRQFAAAYAPTMVPSGAGRNPNNPDDAGWDPAWNAHLPADARALGEGLECDAVFQTWTDAPGAAEGSPIVCVSWYEAFAFCAWDGGRLPTEAEWNYAASGGDEQRVYPWSHPPSSSDIDCSRANYYQNGPDIYGYCRTQADGNGTTVRVGSQSPAGDGRFGHADLSGNAQEFVLDAYTIAYASTRCSDCSDAESSDFRVVRGGSFANPPPGLYSSYRNGFPPDNQSPQYGVRCARDP